MTNNKISIIIPVYNVKDYIDECLQSIISQTYKNIEIILVDDGSTDGCAQICDKYTLLDKRIIVIHQNNRGPALARNAGLAIATGEYIAFIDSDDYICTEYFNKLLYLIKDNNSDISVCSYCSHGASLNNTNSNNILNLSGKDAVKQTYFNKHYYCTSWGKLFKIKLFNNFKFPNCYTEDLNSLYIIYCKANKITFTNERLYCYRNRSKSLIKSLWYEDTLRKLKDLYNGIVKLSQYEALKNDESFYIFDILWGFITDSFIVLTDFKINNKDNITNYLFNILYSKCNKNIIKSINMYAYIWKFINDVKDVDSNIRSKCYTYLKEEIISNCTKENLSSFQKIKLKFYMRFPKLISIA